MRKDIQASAASEASWSASSKSSLFLVAALRVVVATAAQAAAVSITEFVVPTAGSLPVGVATGTDGNIWFTESGGIGKIGRVTTAGTFAEYAIPTGSGPQSITVGPDDNLWFAEQNSSHIGRLILATAARTDSDGGCSIARAQRAGTTSLWGLLLIPAVLVWRRSLIQSGFDFVAAHRMNR